MEEKKAGYSAASNSINYLREITPDAAYVVSILSAASLADCSLHISTSRTKQMFTSPTTNVRNDGISFSFED